MKNSTAWILVLFSLLVISCGGGGGGGGTSDNGTTGSTLTRIRVEGSLPGGNSVDLTNLIPGQTVNVQVVGFDTNNTAQVIPVESWSINATADIATVSNLGSLVTVSAGPRLLTLAGQGGATRYTGAVGIKTGLARVRGLARTPLGAVVPRLIIRYFSASGDEIGSIRTNADGVFQSYVPINARTFVADISDIRGYYDQFDYGTGSFSESVLGCRAKLPTLSSGANVTLPNDVVMMATASGPPPPPPGCFE